MGVIYSSMEKPVIGEDSGTRTERGWAGHFCCANSCLFRRNTLLEKNGVYIVVSSVGSYVPDNRIKPIGLRTYYETKAFYSDKSDLKFHDADIENEIFFDSKSKIAKKFAEIEADKMHEKVVNELINKLETEKI